jgi:hypothetical protein
MTWLRSADASLVWVIEVARICLLVFGCAAAGWMVGFGMGYRRGVNDAIANDIACASDRVNADSMGRFGAPSLSD